MHSFGTAKGEIERGILGKDMVVIVGVCEVNYQGRATSSLPSGKRLVLIKGDGSVSIHQNRLVRPTNYMMDTRISCTEDDGAFIMKAEKQKPRESLEITFSGIEDLRRYAIDLTDDLRLSGSERDLNDLLMQDLSMVEEGLKPINQQQQFRKGVADIVAEDRDGNFVVIELKRREADFEAVTQLQRYMKEVENLKGIKTRGILLAPSIRKKASELLGQLGLEFRKLDFELTPANSAQKAKIKGLQPRQQTITQHLEQ